MTALLIIAIIVGAVVAFSAIAEAARRIRRAVRLHALGDPPPLSDERTDELLRVMRKEDEQR